MKNKGVDIVQDLETGVMFFAGMDGTHATEASYEALKQDPDKLKAYVLLLGRDAFCATLQKELLLNCLKRIISSDKPSDRLFELQEAKNLIKRIEQENVD